MSDIADRKGVLIAFAAVALGCAPRSSPPPASEEIFATDVGQVRSIEYQDGDMLTVARRRSSPDDQFDIVVQRAGGTETGRCSPSAPFAQAYAGIASIRTAPEAAGSATREAGSRHEILRIRDAVEREPGEWAVFVQQAPTFRLFLIDDGGLVPLNLAPQVVRRIALGCAAFE